MNSLITEPLGCSAQASGHCNGWCGIALKLSADLQTTVWRTVFRDVTGGVGDYAPATPLGPSMVFTECWSISKESFFRARKIGEIPLFLRLHASRSGTV